MDIHFKRILQKLWPHRFIVQAMLLSSVMLTLAILAVTIYNTKEFIKQESVNAEQRLGAIANSVALSSAYYLLVRDHGSLEQHLLQAINYPGMRAITVVDQRGQVIGEVRRAKGEPAEAVYDYGKMTLPQQPQQKFEWLYAGQSQKPSWTLGLSADKLVIWQPIEQGNLGWLRLESSVDDVRNEALQQLKNSLLVALVAVLLSVLLLLMLLRPNLRALTAATEFARHLTKNQGQTLPAYTGSSELEQLGSALNEASLRLLAQKTALATANELLSNVLDAASEVSIIATDTQGTITVFNRGAERMLGYAASEMVHKKSPAVLHLLEEVVARGEELTGALGYPVQGFRVFVEMPERTGAEQREWTYVHKDGHHIPVSLVVTAMRSGETITGYLGIAQDISERKRVDRMKSEFVSTVSHELRTPLTSISGALGLITGGALGVMPEKAQQMLSIAHKNSQRLTYLINDLLDMEKLVAGKMHFDLQIQPLQPLLEQSLEDNRLYGAEKQVTMQLQVTLPDALVRVDGQRLLQIMSNLLSNAIKYSPPGGVVEVSVSAQGGRARVSVRDHGPGIPQQFHARIFQKFSQADSSDTRQKGGTGLGLSITRELVVRMGGQIAFESVEGAGACFFFDLPLQVNTVQESAQVAHS